MAANQNQPIWITVPAKAAGILQGKLTLRWTGGEISQPFTVHVHNVTMKKPRLWDHQLVVFRLRNAWRCLPATRSSRSPTSIGD